MNSSLIKRSNRLTKRSKRSNRLTKRNKRSNRSNRLTKRSKRINRLTKRSNRLTKRSNRLSKRNNRLSKRNNRLSKRREIYGGAVTTLTKTNDGTIYFEIERSNKKMLVTSQDINSLAANLKDLYYSMSCFQIKSTFNWDDLWGSINMNIKDVSNIESYLTTLSHKIEELSNDTSIGENCKQKFINAWQTFKNKGKEMSEHINSQVNEGKLLKYSHNRGNFYIFDPLDVTTGKIYDDPSSYIDIFDPVTNTIIASGEITDKKSTTATVEWNYIVGSILSNEKDYTTEVSLRAIKKVAEI